jgi:hypothetical protein
MIGPRVWDLTCWRAQHKSYTVFVLDHVNGGDPTADQCREFLSRLKNVLATSHLRILIPQWQDNMDFLPPSCNGNLIYSRSLECPQYIDFQNFGLNNRDAWSQEVLARAKEIFRFGSGPLFRRGLDTCQSIPCTSMMGNGDTADRWRCFVSGLRDGGLELRDRVVLAIGCNTGAILQHSLGEGAAWGIGWDLPAVIAPAQELLLSRGVTRFSLIPAEMDSAYSLQNDIPAQLHSHLSEAVVFYFSVRPHIGLLETLRTMTWRAFVYEGHETECLEAAQELLKPLLTSGVEIAASFHLPHGNYHSRPVHILKRG